jgi:23S rRNA (cytosine1962-C5)-methyltransferase
MILDPPSYGHGPKGESWKLTEHLAELWNVCLELTRGQPSFLLASCHSEPWTTGDALAEFLTLKSSPLPGVGRIEGCEMSIASSCGEKLRHDKRLHRAKPLHCGAAARWHTTATDTTGSG